MDLEVVVNISFPYLSPEFSKMQFNKTFQYLLFAGIPIIFLVGFGWFVIPHTEDFIRELFNFCINTALVFSVVLIFRKFRVFKMLSLIGGGFLSVLLLVKLSFYAVYNTKLSASALFVIFETNADEATGFLEKFIDLSLILMLIFFMLYLIIWARWLSRKKRPVYFGKIERFYWAVNLVLICITALSCFLIPFRFSDYNLVYKANSSFKEYQKTKAILKKNLGKTTSTAFKNVHTKKAAPKTAVIVIGESTTRTHLGIYGYERNTTPNLENLKDSLFIGSDVISSHVHTISSLEEIMTLKSWGEKNPETNGSIIQMANQAGYKTFWISNQRPVGINETIPTLIGSAANSKTFLNTNDYDRVAYDAVVLPELKRALKDNSSRKVVFLHLMGTHIGYAERYPKNFEHFKNQPKTNFPSDRAFSYINEYDNAVRYNDFVLDKIINQVKNAEKPALMLYFSDHGDDVYENQNAVGHSEYTGTNPMFEIPFVLWKSADLKMDVSRKDVENRPYRMDDFIYSFADLMKIDFQGDHDEKSIFNTNFKPKKRLIKKGEEYEKTD